MKKGLIVLIAVIAVIAIIGLWVSGTYNSLVSSREVVDKQLSVIDTQLQRRNDLIPNIVNTVKGYTSHESEVLGDIADARVNLAGAQSTKDIAQADAELSSAISRLLVVVENYPELKANTQFSALTDELAGTENRIAVARKDYNDAASSYNTMVKTFPRVIFANMFGFSPVEYFEAAAGADKVPEVKF